MYRFGVCAASVSTSFVWVFGLVISPLFGFQFPLSINRRYVLIAQVYRNMLMGCISVSISMVAVVLIAFRIDEHALRWILFNGFILLV